jgi:hypothetical protein
MLQARLCLPTFITEVMEFDFILIEKALAPEKRC